MSFIRVMFFLMLCLVGMVDRILNTVEVSEITRVPPTTLRWWRHQDIGPRSFRLGPRKVMYKESDVLAWLENQYNGDGA
jgi:predicted DNA-binding transcriptional regulator AlpA